MIRSAAALACLLLLAVPAGAQGRGTALWEALRIDEVIEVMRRESVARGRLIEEAHFPGQGGAGWARRVAEIHDPDRMRERVAAGLEEEIGAEAAAPIVDFFTGDLGRRIVALEVEARRILDDEAAESAAIAAARRLAPTRRERIAAIIEASDLVERNVVGVMNANLAFYLGLAEGGAFEGEMTEEAILAEVRASAPLIRAETEDWLHGLLGLAYRPLTGAELDRYLAFSESPAGRDLNAALFVAFDGLFETISRDLGRRAAGYLAGEEL